MARPASVTSMIPNFGKNRNRNSTANLLIKIGAFLILVIVALILVADVKTYQKKIQFANEEANLKSKIDELQKENSNFQQGISMSNDASYLEKVAREELDLQKPGETVVSFITQDQQKSAGDNKQANIWFGWVGNVWNWIKNIF